MLLAENVSVNSKFISESNVAYPKLLQDQKDKSLSYVEKYSKRNRDFLVEVFNTGKNFFPKIANVFEEHGLPPELKVLIAIESGFKSNAVSKAGAVGYWQMMDEMALDYGLKIGKGSKKDDRKNLTKSTTAAARFLKDRFNDFGNNILLTVASYNCGAGNVRKAIRRSGVDQAGFWDIKKYLPKETGKYVMDFIALNVIFENYEKFTNKEMIFKPQIAQEIKPMPQVLIN